MVPLAQCSKTCRWQLIQPGLSRPHPLERQPLRRPARPLVDEETFEKAQQILRRRGEDASLPKDRLEAAVLAQLAGLYRDGQLIERALAKAATLATEERPRVKERLASMRAEVARIERKLERYFEAFETGELSAALCQERVRSHRERLETLREQEADLARTLATQAHTSPDAALAGLADQLDEILATEGPDPSGSGGGSRNAF
jgi:hypothetical protein